MREQHSAVSDQPSAKDKRQWRTPFEIQETCVICGGSLARSKDCECKGTGTITVSIPCEPAAGCLVKVGRKWRIMGERDGKGYECDGWRMEGRSGYGVLKKDITPLLPSPAAVRAVAPNATAREVFAAIATLRTSPSHMKGLWLEMEDVGAEIRWDYVGENKPPNREFWDDEPHYQMKGDGVVSKARLPVHMRDMLRYGPFLEWCASWAASS